MREAQWHAQQCIFVLSFPIFETLLCNNSHPSETKGLILLIDVCLESTTENRDRGPISLTSLPVHNLSNTKTCAICKELAPCNTAVLIYLCHGTVHDSIIQCSKFQSQISNYTHREKYVYPVDHFMLMPTMLLIFDTGSFFYFLFNEQNKCDT